MPSKNKPSVVLFIADEWRGKSTGYFGNQSVNTPCIDSLAAAGAGLTGCFVQNPVSTPSRASMASGWYCHVNGHRTMQHMLRLHEPNLLRYFKEQGYHVWWGGKNDMIAPNAIPESCHERHSGTEMAGEVFRIKLDPENPLFHTFLFGKVPENYVVAMRDKNVLRYALDFLKDPGDKPFFMLINQEYPHPPYAVEEPWYSMYADADVGMPIAPPEGLRGKPRILKETSARMRMNEISDNNLREMLAVYNGMVSQVDSHLGEIMDALKESGHWDNTIVVATSDHGDYAGDYRAAEKMQNCFEDSLVNVPLAIRVPGCDPLPGPSNALVEWVDILPTLSEACNIELGHTHFGRSLIPLLKGEKTEHREFVFSEGGALAEEDHTHEEDRPKKSMYWARAALQMTERDTHGKAAMVRSREWKYVRRMYDTDELYDLKNDPDETNNLVDDPAHAGKVHELTSILLDWFVRSGDQVPLRWDLRNPGNKHPAWSANAARHGFTVSSDV